MKKKNLLIDEYPLLVLPSLAMQIGLNEAIALQQIHYWLGNPKGGLEIDGERWVYNTYEEWQVDNFPFWSVRTVQRIFNSLEDMGLVISMQQAAYDRKKYYRVHYDKLASWSTTDWHNAEFQTGALDDDKLASPSITETTETTGADAPQNLDWQIGMGQTTIVLPDNDTAQRRDAANLIGTGLGINAKAGAELAFAFQDERKMTFTNSEIKGQRKAVKFLLEKKVKPEHVRQAVQKLVSKSFTVADLFSITKDAIDIANQAPVVTSDRPERKIHRAEEDQSDVIDFNEAKRRGLIPG